MMQIVIQNRNDNLLGIKDASKIKKKTKQVLRTLALLIVNYCLKTICTLSVSYFIIKKNKRKVVVNVQNSIYTDP